MLRFFTMIAALVVLATTHITAKADGVLGKTIKASWQYEGCGDNGRCSQGRFNVNVYVSREGNIFDYGSGAGGSVVRLGQRSKGVTYLASGNVFTSRSDKFDLNFAISGSGCTISLVNVRGPGTLRIFSEACSVVEGQSGR